MIYLGWWDKVAAPDQPAHPRSPCRGPESSEVRTDRNTSATDRRISKDSGYKGKIIHTIKGKCDKHKNTHIIVIEIAREMEKHLFSKKFFLDNHCK